MVLLFPLVILLVWFVLPFAIAFTAGRLRPQWPDGRLLLLSSAAVPVLVVGYVVFGLVRALLGGAPLFGTASQGSLVSGIGTIVWIGVTGGGIGLFAGIVAVMFRRAP